MTRQERRRQSRNKKTTYNLTPEQIASMAFESQKQAYNEMKDGLNGILKEEAKQTILEALTLSFYLPLLSMRTKEGWGKKRLKRYAQDLVNQWEMYEENYFTIKDIKEMLVEETGLDIEFEPDFKNKKTKIKLICKE